MIEEVKRQIGEQGRDDINGVVNEIRKVKAEWFASWRPRLESDEVPMNEYRVLNELHKAVDVSNTIATHDAGYPRDRCVRSGPPRVQIPISGGASRRSWAMVWGWHSVRRWLHPRN